MNGTPPTNTEEKRSMEMQKSPKAKEEHNSAFGTNSHYFRINVYLYPVSEQSCRNSVSPLMESGKDGLVS